MASQRELARGRDVGEDDVRGLSNLVLCPHLQKEIQGLDKIGTTAPRLTDRCIKFHLPSLYNKSKKVKVRLSLIIITPSLELGYWNHITRP